MFTDTYTTYEPKISRVALDLEYFQRNVLVQAPDIILIFPTFIEKYNDDAMQKSIIAIQKLMLVSPEKYQKEPFWANTQRTFLEGRDVFRFFGQHTGRFIDSLERAGIQEIVNNPRRRAMALCASHDVDGYVSQAKCEAAGVNPKNVAVMVLDAHEDIADSDGKSGAVKAMVEKHGFGHVIVMGIPDQNKRDLYANHEVLINEMYNELQVIFQIKRQEYYPFRRISKERFTNIVRAFVENHADQKLMLEMMKNREVAAIYHALHESSLIYGKYTSMVYQNNLEKINANGTKIEYQSMTVDYEQLEQSFIKMKKKGIKYLLWSMDVDAFDTIGMKLTVPEYTNWWLLAILGIPEYAYKIINAVSRADRLKAVASLLFEGVRASMPSEDSDLPLTISSNVMARFDGLTLPQCGEYIERVSSLAMKYGIKIGVVPKKSEPFYGTITELPPNSPDYQDNTAIFVRGLALFVHKRSAYYNGGARAY